MKDDDGTDPYRIPKQLNKYKRIDSGNKMSTSTIVDRIIKNAMQYTLRNLKKEKKELELFRMLSHHSSSPSSSSSSSSSCSSLNENSDDNNNNNVDDEKDGKN
mgnify:CR=1 FL=1